MRPLNKQCGPQEQTMFCRKQIRFDIGLGTFGAAPGTSGRAGTEEQCRRALTGVPSPLPLRSVTISHTSPTSTVSTFRFQRGTCAQRTKTKTDAPKHAAMVSRSTRPHPPRVLQVQRRRVALQSANSVETPSKLIGFVNQIRYELAGPRSLLGRNTSSSCSPDPGRPSGPNPLPCRPVPGLPPSQLGTTRGRGRPAGIRVLAWELGQRPTGPTEHDEDSPGC